MKYKVYRVKHMLYRIRDGVAEFSFYYGFDAPNTYRWQRSRVCPNHIRAVGQLVATNVVFL